MEIAKDDFNRKVLAAFEHILKVLFNRNEKESIRLTTSGPAEQEREIAILIQFIGGIEGKIILACSKETALDIAKSLPGFDENTASTEAGQRDYIKNSLGEIMNMLAGKIAYGYQKDFGTTRITTPAMISGKLLFITVYDEDSIISCIKTPFGLLEIIFSVC
ncbi:MAG: chemotaxis protein CheX [Spirochaetales bacterium]|nr:chemotaxis protein CheX [Spirochaetales bacterium]